MRNPEVPQKNLGWKKKKSQKTNTRYSLHQSLIIYLKYINGIYLSFQTRKIYCSLCWWDCILSIHSSKWVSWQEQGWVWDVITETVLPFRAPALPTTDVASGHHISQTPALQGHPQRNGDAHQQAGDVKSLLAPADTKMGNKWCKSTGSTKCTRTNICIMQACHWKRAPRYSVYPRIFYVFS